MKANLFITALFALVFTSGGFAQDRTTVTATTNDISDNLDLKAVASIFGDSENLSDFERKLNDPKMQISNLDLNADNQVDYLRVIESVERNTHLIIIQSVLGSDVFQDVATVEVERDRHNNVQVQVVGDSYMYGNNYIYEPVYYQQPLIYNTFWVNNYRPYYSSWYWGFYPAYYYAWSPYPYYTYCNNINPYINAHHHYNYVNYRRSQTAMTLHRGRRANGYEVQHPNRSFAHRNAVAANRYELDQIRNNSTGTPRSAANTSNPRNEVPRSDVRSATAPANLASETSATVTTPRTNPRSPQAESITAEVNEATPIVTPRGLYTGPRNGNSTNTVGTPRPVKTAAVQPTQETDSDDTPRPNVRSEKENTATPARSEAPRESVRQAPERSGNSPTVRQSSNRSNTGGSNSGNNSQRNNSQRTSGRR